MQPRIRIARVQNFWEYYWFIQWHNIKAGWLLLTNLVYAFPLCVFDWYYYPDKVLKLGAYHNNRMVGLLVGMRPYKRIDYLYICKHFRKHGIASRLIKASGFTAVISTDNAVRFWQAQGFTRSLGYGIYTK